jgi:hypothetical protein
MTCRELTELLCDYVGGELSDELCCTIRTHLDCCSTCVHFVETYRLTIQITRQLPATPPPDSLLQRLRQALQDDA